MYSCPKCGSNHVGTVLVDMRNEEPLVHCHCISCEMEWVE